MRRSTSFSLVGQGLFLICSIFVLFGGRGGVRGHVFNVVDYGAIGDGKSLDTNAVRNATAALASVGGGTLLFPKGQYLTAPFNLSDNTLLMVQQDAVVLAIQSFEDWPIVEPLPSYNTSRDGPYTRYQPFIFSYNASNITLVGPGVIDGQGEWWWPQFKNSTLTVGRPELVEINGAKGVTVDSIQLQNSPFWTLHIVYCVDVYIHNNTITNPPSSPNTDGMDIDSTKNVLIEYNTVSVGDDHVAMKSGFNQAGLAVNISTENVTYQYNTLYAGHGMSTGSESSGGIFNVLFQHNIMYGPAEAGCRVKTARERGGSIANITYYNNTLSGSIDDGVQLNMEYDRVSTQQNTKMVSEGSVDYPPPYVHDIYFTHLVVIGGGSGIRHAGVLQCLSDAPCSNIYLEDIDLSGAQKGWTCQNITKTTIVNVTPTLTCPSKK